MTFHRRFQSSPQQVKFASLSVLAICLCGLVVLFSGCLPFVWIAQVVPLPVTESFLRDYALFDHELYALVTIERGIQIGDDGKTKDLTVGIIKLSLNDDSHTLVAAYRTRDKRFVEQYDLHLCGTNAFVFFDSGDLVRISCPSIGWRDEGNKGQIESIRTRSQEFKILGNHRYMLLTRGEDLIVDLSAMRILDMPEGHKTTETAASWMSKREYSSFAISDDMTMAALSPSVNPQVWIYSLPSQQRIYQSVRATNTYVELFAVANLRGRPTVLERDLIYHEDPNSWRPVWAAPVLPEHKLALYQEGIGKISEIEFNFNMSDPAYDPDMDQVITLSIPQSNITVPFTVYIWHPFQNRTEQKSISISALLKELMKIR
jgi:hypothetical protein